MPGSDFGEAAAWALERRAPAATERKSFLRTVTEALRMAVFSAVRTLFESSDESDGSDGSDGSDRRKFKTKFTTKVYDKDLRQSFWVTILRGHGE